MFIIFGSPRSGTTLLAQCLNAHGEIVVRDETDFIDIPPRRIGVYKESLDREALEYHESQAAEALDSFGYELVSRESPYLKKLLHETFE